MLRTMPHFGRGLDASCITLVLTLCFTAMTSVQCHAVAIAPPQASLHRVIYYYQTLTDLSPVINNLNPTTRKPYATDINLPAFHLGPQTDGTFIHPNDHPPYAPTFNTPFRNLPQRQTLVP